MQQETVSIIIPVHNNRDTLQRCLDSVLDQSGTFVEIILVNDGSTDGSGALCDEAARRDRRVRVIHQANGGVSAARNAGMDRARGRYLQFVDADDWLESRATEQLLAGTAGQAHLVLCGYRSADEHGRGEQVIRPPLDEGLYSGTEILGVLDRFLEGHLVNPVFSKLYCHRLIREGGVRFREDLSGMEDLLFNIQFLVRCERIAVVSATPYHYFRNRPGSITGTVQPRFLDMQKMLHREIRETLSGRPEIPARVTDLREAGFRDGVFRSLEMVHVAGIGSRPGPVRERIREIIGDPEVRRAFSRNGTVPWKRWPVAWGIRQQADGVIHLYFRLRAVLRRGKRTVPGGRREQGWNRSERTG